MTVATETRKAGPYIGNDLATVFPFSFKVFAADDLQVLHVDTDSGVETVLDAADYSVDLNPDQDNSPGGTVIYPLSGDPITDTETLTVLSELDYTQATELQNLNAYSLKSVEQRFDYVTILAQQLLERASRALTFPASDASPLSVLPTASARANKFLYFNGDGSVDAATPINTDALTAGVIVDLVENSPSTQAELQELLDIPQDAGWVTEVLTASAPDVTAVNALILGIDDWRKRTGAEITAGVTPAKTSYPPADIRRQGVVGTANDSAVLTAAFAQSAATGVEVHVPKGVTVNIANVVVPLGARLRLDGDLAGVAGGTNVLSIADDIPYITVYGTGRINTNGLTYGINSAGNHLSVSGITFFGHVLGSYIFSTGDYCDVFHCRVLPGYDCSNIPFKMYGARPRFFFNRLEDTRGFGVQAAFCTNAQIIGNWMTNPTYTTTKVATSGQVTFTNVNLSVDDIDRWAAWVNGVQTEINMTAGNAPVHTGGGNYTIKMVSGVTLGATVSFFGSRSLENIQFNSECHGGIIALNTCDGTGDSNIVICADYHDGVIHPTAPGSDVDEGDYPQEVIISGNICLNAFAAGINMSQSIGALITGNTCKYFGIRHDGSGGPFYSGIFTGRRNVLVNSNTIISRGSGVQYGIAGWRSITNANEDGSTFVDFSKPSNTKKFGVNNFIGTFTAEYFCAARFANGERRFGVDISDGIWMPYPQPMQACFDAAFNVAGRPNTTDYWQWDVVDGPTPATQDTVLKLGYASMQLSATKRVRATVLATAALQYGLLKFSFWAVNSVAGQQGYVSVYYDNGVTSEPRINMVVNSTTWKQYEMEIPVSTYDSAILIDFTGGASGTTNFEFFDLQHKRLSIL